MTHPIRKFSFAALAALALTPAVQAADYLGTGQNLTPGQFIVAPNKGFYAVQQSDGNFCVYKGSGPGDMVGTRAVWCHMKHGAEGQYFSVMQGDGNLCTYRGTPASFDKAATWCHMKHGATGAYFTAMQNDGNLCTYRGTSPSDNKGFVWCTMATSTPAPPPPPPVQVGVVPGFVKQFAPLLVFHSGSDGYGYPMSAQTFRDAMKNKDTKYPFENRDKASLANGSIPTYYQVRMVGRQTRIRYWFFYGYQHPCTGSQGSHNGDWENVIVILKEDRSGIAAIRFSQHDSFYTRIAGPRDAPATPAGIGRNSGSHGFEKRGTQPVVYVGKTAHGSYHKSDGGLAGALQCVYYGDARGGGPTMNSAQNLIDLDSKAEPWIEESRVSTSNWAWGPDGISTQPPKAAPEGAIKSCLGNPSGDFGGAGSAYNNGPGCFYSECLSGDDQASERCIKECKPGYTNVGLTCNKGKWPWEWSVYGRLNSGNYYWYSYDLPTTDLGLSRRRNGSDEWGAP